MRNDTEILDALDAAEAQARREREEFQQQMEEHQARTRQADLLLRHEVMPNVQPTTVAEYAAFVVGYLKGGGTISYARDRALRTGRYYTALRSFTLPPLFGAQSINVLVPEGVTVVRGGRGHSAVLYMDGYRLDGAGLEMFADVAAYLRRGAS